MAIIESRLCPSFCTAHCRPPASAGPCISSLQTMWNSVAPPGEYFGNFD